ncbi:MAG TPA: hypothetical protein VFM82_12370 [Flavobacteriaceae bacterium]|nr:hypothetical protein [Flavobacteriaceae bacterium]
MKKIKINSMIFVALLILGVTFVGCENEIVQDDFNESENLQLSQESTQNYDNLNGSPNPYDDLGKQFYDFLHEVSNKIAVGYTVEEITQFMENSDFNYSLDLNNDEMSIYRTYFSKKEINIENLNSFENYVINNESISKKEKLLKSATFVKWTLIFQNDIDNEQSLTFACFDNCMNNSLADVFQWGNIVDKIGFIVGSPESTLWMMGSCAYDCA